MLLSIPENRVWTLGDAYDYCLEKVASHYENFPVASRLLPKNVRKHIASVYAFARTADDFADEKQFAGQRLPRLNAWQQQLESIGSQKQSHPVFMALEKTIQTFDIPISLFGDLIHAFKMDVEISRYQTFDDVLGYCKFSANPVGRIVLYIMGYAAPRFLEYSDAICTALQLTNFWQDISIDLQKNRIYIPGQDFNHFGYTEEELQNGVYNENFKRLVFFEIQRTQEFFDRGKPLLGKIPGRFGFELRLTWLGGSRILQKLLKNNADVFKERPVLKKLDFLVLLARAFNKNKFNLET